MSYWKKLLFFIIFSGLSVSLALVSAAPGTNAPLTQTSKSEDTVDAAKVYVENCSICHGDKGDGNTRTQGSLRPPPRNFTTMTSAVELTRERMILSVANGRPGTGMMPHKDRLSEQQIAAVVDYIRGNFMTFPEGKDSKQLAKHVSGEKIYSKHCSVCHGDKGTSAIWARNGLNPQPRDFTTAEARKELTRERMIVRSEERRVGKECRSRWSPYH